MQMLLLVETGPAVAGTFNPNRNTANATYTPAAGEIGYNDNSYMECT
jgi:hypothetical protein